VPCPRILPVKIHGEGEPEQDAETECEGQVRVYGYFDPGSMYGGPDHTGSPPEGEQNADACDSCHFEDWTVEQVTQMTEQADTAPDDGDRDDGPDTEAERD
jgi:hypothetical protein